MGVSNPRPHLTEARRLHQCHDGIWRHAEHHARGFTLTKLDEGTQPVGEPQKYDGCVHFSFATG